MSCQNFWGVGSVKYLIGALEAYQDTMTMPANIRQQSRALSYTEAINANLTAKADPLMCSSDGKYRIVLYIDSAKPKDSGISDRLRQLCRKHLTEPYTFEVIDLHENPALLEQQRIIAVPTLDVTTPQSQQRRFVGDLSVSESFIIASGMFHNAEKMRQNASEMGRNVRKLKRKYK